MYVQACRICSNATNQLRDSSQNISYHSCSGCEYIFVDDSHVLTEEEEKARYLLHENTVENDGHVRIFRDFIEKAVAPYKSSIKKVLEFGCGSSPVLSSMLIDMGFHVDIYDKFFAPEEIYINNTYDLITATEVMEHLRDPLPTIKLLKKHTNKKGIIAIMTAFHPLDETKFMEWWYRRDKTHISFYTPVTFKYAAELLDLKLAAYDDKNIIVLQKYD
jgi:hypothetical protein